MSKKQHINATLNDEGNFTSISFIKTCSNEEIEPLVQILTRSSTSKLSESEFYKLYSPNHKKYIQDIIDDYEKFGGNTFANVWRGHGIGYKEILKDVCKQMKVNLPKDASINVMELALITKISEEAIEKMTLQEREEFVKSIDPKITDFSKQAVLLLARSVIRQAGFNAYKLLVKLVYIIGTKILGKTVPFIVYQTSTKWLGSFAGPVGLALTSAWTIIDLAGPAYRVTIPATMYIATLRQAKLYEATHSKCSLCETLNDISAKFCSECGKPLLGES